MSQSLFKHEINLKSFFFCTVMNTSAETKKRRSRRTHYTTRHLVGLIFYLPVVCAQTTGDLEVNVDINNVNHDLSSNNLANALPADYTVSKFTDGAVSDSLQTSCPAGFYCPSGGTSAPVPCPAGTYQTGLAMTAPSQCLHCTAGSYCPSPSVQPTPCPQGTFLTGLGFSTPSHCVLCGQGTYQTGTGAVASASCIACLSGTFQTGTGMVSSGQCTSCLAGTFQPITRAINSSQCLPCPTGFFCPTNSSNHTVPCAMGTYQPVLGATSSMQCLACPTGGYCPVNSTLVLACPGGTFQPATRVTNITGCITATIGHFSPPNSSMQTTCPAGSRCSTPGMAAPIPCGRGFFQSSTGQSLCMLCPVGQFCPFETTWGPQGCPPGTYSNLTGATAASNCNDSVVGGFVTPNASSITICPVGHLCNTTRLTAPIPCGAGLFQNVTGQSVCRTCPVTNFCPNATTDQPLQCLAGHLCNVTGLTSPIPCGLGNFQPNMQQSVCMTCPVGRYCPFSNTLTPIDCDAGSFRVATGAQTQADCAACPLGQFCVAGASVPTNCPAGTFRNTTGAQSLASCPACSVGKFAFMSTGLTADCSDCPANAYCSSPLTIAQCPLRTNSSAGSSSLLHCICNAGFRCTYSKRISLVVTISGNFSVSNFQNNVNGIQDRFKQAVANATRVSVSQINITNVQLRTATRRRRLLMMPVSRVAAAHIQLHVDHISRFKKESSSSPSQASHRQIVWPSSSRGAPQKIKKRLGVAEMMPSSLEVAAVVHGAHEVVDLDHYLAQAAIPMQQDVHDQPSLEDISMDNNAPDKKRDKHTNHFSHDSIHHVIADPQTYPKVSRLWHTHYHELFVSQKEKE